MTGFQSESKRASKSPTTDSFCGRTPSNGVDNSWPVDRAADHADEVALGRCDGGRVLESAPEP